MTMGQRRLAGKTVTRFDDEISEDGLVEGRSVARGKMASAHHLHDDVENHDGSPE